MADSIKEQMIEIAKNHGYIDPQILVKLSGSELIISIAGSFELGIGKAEVEQALAAVKEFLESE